MAVAQGINAVKDEDGAIDVLINEVLLQYIRSKDAGLRKVVEWIARDFGSDDLTDRDTLTRSFRELDELNDIVRFLTESKDPNWPGFGD